MREPVTIVPPRWEPVSVPELRKHVGLSHSDADDLLLGYLRAAREHAERITGRAFAEQTFEVTLDGFESVLYARRTRAPEGYATGVPGAILLPRVPVRSIVSVIWKSEAGADTTIDPARYAFTSGEPSLLLPVGAGVDWPSSSSVLYRVDPVRVRFVAGYTSRDEVPETVRQWIRLQAASWFENRESEIAGGANVATLPSTAWCLRPLRVDFA